MDQFIGTWKLDKSEQFDEYLAAKGVPWLIRKIILASSMLKTIEKVDDQTYMSTDKGSKSTTNWKFRLGETFEAKGFDGKMHKITFEMKDDKYLIETHIRIEDPKLKDQPEIFRYERQGDQLILHLDHENIRAKRFFKK